MPSSTAQRGSCMGAYWGHSKPYSAFSLPSMPALKCSLAWDPDSRSFPLQAFGFISPSASSPSVLLRDSPCTLKKKDPRHLSGTLGAACLIPSEETAGKLPSKTHLWAASPPEVLSAAHFKQVFIEQWESWTGWKNWINAFAYPRDQILKLKSFFTKSPVKASYRRKNMQATFSLFLSHPPHLRVNKATYTVCLGKHKQPPFPASVWELTGKAKKLSSLKDLANQDIMTLIMNIIMKRCTVLIIFPLGKNRRRERQESSQITEGL